MVDSQIHFAAVGGKCVSEKLFIGDIHCGHKTGRKIRKAFFSSQILHFWRNRIAAEHAGTLSQLFQGKMKPISASQGITVGIAVAEDEDIILFQKPRSRFLPINSHMNLLSFLDAAQRAFFLRCLLSLKQ